MTAIAPVLNPDLGTGDAAPTHALSASAKPLRIALLGYRSHPFVGGQGIYLRYLSRALTDLGHQVQVFSGPPYPELDPDIPLTRVPSLDLYAQASVYKAWRWRYLRSWTDSVEWWSKVSGGFAEPYTFGRRLQHVLKPDDFDIIHDNQSLSYGLLTLQAQGATVVSTIHHPIHRDLELALGATANWGERLLVKRWHSFLRMQEKVARKLKHVVTVSSQSQRDIVQYFQRPANTTPVIFNGIDTRVFRPLSHCEEDAQLLLTTSSSDQPLKGLMVLLKALLELRERNPKVRLRIIGKLKEDGESARFIQQHGLSDAVECVHGISTTSLVEHYNRAAVVVCPSLYEGFGLPAAEAMACGRAVVSSDGGALPEVIGNAGCIVKAGDSQALADTLASLLSAPHTRKTLGQQARERAEACFCWTRVAQELSTYYSHCLTQRAHGNT